MSMRTPRPLSTIRRMLENNRNSQQKLRDEEKELVQEERYAESVAAGKLLKVHGVSVEEMEEILKKARQERGTLPKEPDEPDENTDEIKEDSNEEVKV